MNKECFDFISFLNEPDTNITLSEMGYFCGDYSGSGGISSKVLREIGLTSEDMLNNLYISRIHSDDLESYLMAMKRFHSGQDEDFFCEYRIKAKDGSWHWIQTHACVISKEEDGTIKKIFGMDRDITAMRNARSFLFDSPKS